MIRVFLISVGYMYDKISTVNTKFRLGGSGRLAACNIHVFHVHLT
jgi:hypothetical protein